MAALVLILAGAAALRFWGLRWGLPNELHDYSYHPDEFLTIGAAFGMIYLGRTWNPHFYNYPSLYIYLSALAIAVGLGYGASPAPATIYLCARVMTALMGTAAVAATWWAGRTLFGEGVGLLAALEICVAPLHVQHSHFATVDVPSTLFVALALGSAGLILKNGSRRDYLLGGAMAGLAAGTKYNAGLVLLSVVAAHFLREGWKLGSLKSGRLWGGIGCALGAFVISTPGSVLAASQFVHGLTYEMHHAAEGHGLVFAGTGNGFVYTFASSLWYGLGPGLAALFALAVLWALWRRDKQALAILAFVVPYYALVSLSNVRFARYAMPLFPAVAVLIAHLVCDRCSRLRASMPLRLVGLLLWVVACTSAVICSLAYAFLLDLSLVASDPRDQAARWIFSHVPRGSTIGVLDWPWFYSPPLTKDLGFGTLPQREQAALNAPYRIVLIRSVLHGVPTPDWAMAADYEAEDAVRLFENRSISGRDRKEVDRIAVELNWIEHRYKRRAVFWGALRSLGWLNAPHDMRYPDPAISILERRR